MVPGVCFFIDRRNLVMNVFSKAVCMVSAFLASHTSVSQFVRESAWSKGQPAEGLVAFL